MISNILSKVIKIKLKTDISKLKKEKSYANSLSNNFFLLDKKKNSKFKISDKIFNSEDFLVSYIITFHFLRANTTICVSDIKGNVKLFYSSGSVDLSGKQKKNRTKSVAVSTSASLRRFPWCMRGEALATVGRPRSSARRARRSKRSGSCPS